MIASRTNQHINEQEYDLKNYHIANRGTSAQKIMRQNKNTCDIKHLQYAYSNLPQERLNAPTYSQRI